MKKTKDLIEEAIGWICFFALYPEIMDFRMRCEKELKKRISGDRE